MKGLLCKEKKGGGDWGQQKGVTRWGGGVWVSGRS